MERCDWVEILRKTFIEGLGENGSWDGFESWGVCWLGFEEYYVEVWSTSKIRFGRYLEGQVGGLPIFVEIWRIVHRVVCVDRTGASARRIVLKFEEMG